jgi:GNAT superfamily N-acetyltransferase
MQRISVAKPSRLGYVVPEVKRIARISGLDLYLSKADNTYYVEALHMDRAHKGMVKRAMIVTIVPDEEYDAAYTIDMVSVDSEYQGMGLAPKVYRKLLKRLPKLLLKAATIQSPGGRYIWYTLAKYRDIDVYAMTPTGRYHGIELDDVSAELTLGHTDIYDNERTEYAVFACASR